jgi:hypothetical protein
LALTADGLSNRAGGIIWLRKADNGGHAEVLRMLDDLGICGCA